MEAVGTALHKQTLFGKTLMEENILHSFSGET